MTNENNVVGNAYDKYGTNNPIAKYLMRSFLEAVGKIYSDFRPQSVLEVGCGEGRLANELIGLYEPPHGFVASDISLEKLDNNLSEKLSFVESSVYELPYPDNSFDLIVCCEVLEHLENPVAALSEIARVAKRGLLVSTPWEPVWRILNMARGKYLSELGNTPGHIQHFSRAGLRSCVEKDFYIIDQKTPIPWTILLGKPRESD